MFSKFRKKKGQESDDNQPSEEKKSELKTKKKKSFFRFGNSPQQQSSSPSCSTTNPSSAQKQQQSPTPQQQQQQYLANCGSSTMPAMPKEKATAVSLTETNFSELKYKELATSAAVVAASAAAAAAMASTASAPSPVVVVNSSPLQIGGGTAATLRPQNCSSPLHQHHHTHQHQHQRNLCGYGNQSAAEVTMRTRHMSNENASPLSAAMAPGNTSRSASTSPQQLSDTSIGSGFSCNISGQGSPLTSPSATTTNTLNPNASTSPPVASTPPKKTPRDFIFGKFIGEGSFSNVFLAVDVNTRREYAIKICEKRQILREHKQDYIRREREVMHAMTNVPGFVNLSCTFQDYRSLYFVMTYAKNSDLLPYINKVGSFDVEATRHYAAELVLACEQMHIRNIIHRDLKPENILLDEDMHTLIGDFGSVKMLSDLERQKANEFLLDGGIDLSKAFDSSNDNLSDVDELDLPTARRKKHRKRRGSFVGTAQYVSPEVLKKFPITPAADLWALGCIIYQMVSGLPPFRGSNDYMIFKEIISCNLMFPEGFDKDAEDLVRRLLKLNPAERLGALDLAGRYDSIRSHPFFKPIDFDSVRTQTPPPMSTFQPELINEEEDLTIFDNLTPGLDDKQMTRLLGMELGCVSDDDVSDKKKTVANKLTKTNNKSSASCSSNASSSYNALKSSKSNSFDLSDAEKHRRLELQKSDKWHAFADGEVILKKGYLNKRKGLFARRRMFLLCTGPRLIYIDPVQMVKKGEIPWSSRLSTNAKNFKTFFVHTPNRTYYLDDPEGFVLQWVEAINKMHILTYGEQIDDTSTSCASSILKTSSTTSAASSALASASVPSVSSSPSPSSSKTKTPNKTSSLLAKPITLLKTSSN